MKNVEDIYPLSPLQSGMLFHSLMEPESGVYVNQVTCTLAQDLDVRLFRQAWERLIKRHGVLRTAFFWEGLDEPVQVVRKTFSLPWQDLDWRGLSAEERQLRFEELRHRDRHTPLPLSQAPLMRFSLIRFDGEHGFIWTSHHLLMDGWSLPLLVRELGAVYAALRDGHEPALPPVRPFSDYVVWLRKQDLSRAEPFWREELAGFTAPNALSIITPAGPAGASSYAEHEIRLSLRVTADLQDLAARHRLTLQTVTLGAWAVLLSRYSGEEDVVFGGVVSGRPAALPDVETMVGMFINTLPVRVRVSGAESLAPWLQNLQTRQLARQEFAHSPLHRVQQWSRTPAGSPLFETLYVFENYPTAGDSDLDRLQIGNLRSIESTNYPLTLTLKAADQMSLQVASDRARVDEDAALRLLRHLATMLTGMAERPERRVGELSLLTAEEALQLRAWNETAIAYPLDRPLHAWIEDQAGRSPEAVALAFETEELTYRELDRRANRLARQLRACGCAPESRVGVLLERSCELLVALLGILKAGAAYVPLDPEHPASRLAFQDRDAGLRRILTRADLAARLPGAEDRFLFLEHGGPAPGSLDDVPLSVTVDPDHPAYVLYTSGSTGRPKGAAISHRAIANRLLWMQQALHLSAADRVLQKTPFSFDVSVWELFWPLMTGARLVVARPGGHRDNAYLTRLIAGQEITVLHFVPPMLQLFLEEPGIEECRTLRDVVCSGEALSAELARRFANRLGHARLHNLYGPTEAAVDVTSWICEAADTGNGRGSIPIGRPIANTRIHLLDSGLLPVPVGVPGELFIGGVNLARGYVGRPDLTAERFLPDSMGGEPGERVYRTGDLARWRDGGAIEFLGRLDHQVKIRGFRIELGEVEAALAALPGVGEAVVVAREDRSEGGPGGCRLVAYLVGEAPADALRQALSERLPDYMVPAAFVTLTALPLTPNGKVDRKALPAPERMHTATGVYTAPRNTLEQTIAGIWQEVLGLDRVGREDNFFDAGGHSLLMLQVHARLRERLGRDLTIVELFQYPTVRALAGHLGEDTAAPPAVVAAPLAPLERPVTGFAVIGMAGRFPGAADVEELWANLRDSREAVVPFTDEEMREAGVSPESLADPRYVRSGTVLEGIELFDAEFFGFSPREAEMMDPQQRLFLEASWQALEDAGYDPRGVPGRVGVWGGADMSTYAFHVLARPDLLQEVGLWAARHGIDKDLLVTRVSYELDLRGPSVAVQTACSTSLVAVHHACRSLASGECDTALAGGVQVSPVQRAGYLYEQGAISSPDGHCRAFDARAQGTISGSGVGVVVLKRLEDALRDGDTIRAVIRGTAINNDGSLKVGFTAPSVEGQAEVIAMALAAAGVSPDTIGYVEAHGTGTPLGDPIEVAALTRAFRLSGTATDRTGFCGLGSIKTNIGHLGSAAGVAGLIKTVIALEHRQIPPSLHFETPNPAIDFAAGPFRVVDRLTDWPANGVPRRAGVSSFGIGGTNAHAVLEEAPAAEPSGASRPFQLLLLSARTPGALEEATTRLTSWLENHPEPSLADVAHTLRRGRHAFEHRRMLVCASREDALAALRSHDPERLLARRRESEPPAVAWLLPGQGSQHPGMGRDLYDSEPVFRREIDACAERLGSRLGRDLREVLFASSDAELAATRFAQPALFVVEHALARLWLSWGLRPQALIGHSLGEYVAACLAGVLSLDDALILVAARGELMQELPPGAMLSVDLSESAALAEIAAAPGLSLAAINGPGQCVVSGPAGEIDGLAERLVQRATPCRRLQTSHAFHSGMMEPILGRFAEVVARVTLRPPSIPYLSNLTGAWTTAAEATDPRSWVRHLRETVRFGDGVSRLLAELPPAAVLLEVGPGQALGRLVRGQATGRTVLASMPHPGGLESGTEVLLRAMGRLWLTGVEIDWQAFQGEERRRRVPLPTYPFQRRRHWVEAGRVGLSGGAAPVALLLPEGAAADPAWTAALEARGFQVVAVPPDRARPEALDDLLAPRHPAREPAPPEASGHVRPGVDTPYEEPSTELERRLAAIWESLLGIDRVGVHDDFFELGGHSLLATRLLSRVREDFQREIQLEAVFAAPTVARLAAHLAGSGEPSALQGPPILPVPRTRDLPVSYAQQRLLFLAVMAPGDPSYNLPLGLRLDGRLDVRALWLALDALVARHEPLRTTFRIDENRVAQVIAPAASVPLPRADLSGLPTEAREAEARRLALEQARYPFDLLRGPVVIAQLARLAPTEHLLLLTVHHIAADGWSFTVLYRDMTELYQAIVESRRPLLPELPVQYADFAAWQRTAIQEEGLARHLDYWRNHLAGARAPSLPTDRPRPLRPSGRGATLPVTLPAGTADAARRLARAEDATLFMILLGAFAVILHRASGCDDLLIGTDIANRNRRETEDLIGLFVNQLVLRNDLSGNPTFRDLVRRVRRTTLNAYAHQDAPFDRLVDALNPVRDLGTTPLFQVKLVLQNAQMPVYRLTDLEVSPFEVHNQTAKFDLLLNLAELGDSLSGVLEYNADLWDEASMARLAGDFAAALASGSARPDDRISRIEESLSRPSSQPGTAGRALLRRRGIPVALD